MNLHGFADVEAKTGELGVAWVKQRGNAVLEISTDPEVDGDMYLLLEPTTGDPNLGLAGWGPDFVSKVVGFTHMAQPSVTIYGLPDNRPIHAALFANDNLAGAGAATFAAGTKNGTVPIYAVWSNDKHDPPPRLQALTDHVASHRLTIGDFIESDSDGTLSRDELQVAAEELYASILTNPDKMVEVPGLGQRPLIDVLAAIEYSDMRKWTEKRQRK